MSALGQSVKISAHTIQETDLKHKIKSVTLPLSLFSGALGLVSVLIAVCMLYMAIPSNDIDMHISKRLQFLYRY